ncbi:MAG: hypothetical protein F4153_07875 [Acidimicrobiia bacterium]|nr:hypothetical protein [Acidimicrobiia bacterium]
MLFAGLPASFDAKWSRRGVGLVLAFVLAATGLVVASAQGATAQTANQSAAERCSEFHLFGAEPVDVAKTADGETVLAQVSWGYHTSIGCFLSLDGDAVSALRAAGPPPSLPQGQTDTSARCFDHHRFGAEPVDVAKTADGGTVLARLSWGYHASIGCFLTLDSAAVNTLRDAAAPPTAPSAPGNVSATAGEGQIDVTWIAPADNGGAPIIDYTVAYKGDATACPTSIDITWNPRIISTTSATIEGLTNGVAYLVCGWATNLSGPSDWGSTTASTATSPGAPGNVTAVAGDSQLRVTWTAPVDNGGAPVTAYSVAYKANAFTCPTRNTINTWIVGTTSSTTVTLVGLANSHSYRVCVQATNSAGDSGWVGTTNSPSNRPGEPTGVQIISRGPDQLTVAWNAPAATGGSAITGYTVQWCTATNNACASSWSSASATGTSIGISGLSGGTSYGVRVQALNSSGTGRWSNTVFSSTPPPPPPGPPTGLAATVEDRQLALRWNEPPSNGSPISHYTIECRLGGTAIAVGSCGSSNWIAYATVSTNSTTVRGLANGTAYDIRVRATNRAGSSGWATVSATPAAVPRIPTNMTATTSGRGIDVTWTAPADGGSPITRYTVQYCSGGCANWQTRTVSGNPPATTTTLTGLASSTTYRVRVRAVNSAGESGWSATDTATTPTRPETPTNLQVTVGGPDTLNATWTAPIAPSGITGYTVQRCNAAANQDGTWRCVSGYSNAGTAATTSHTLTGLNGSTSYLVRVQAFNAAGPSGWVTAASAATTEEPEAPLAPTGLTPTAGNRSIRLSWTAPAARGARITRYTITCVSGISDGNHRCDQASPNNTYTTSGTSYTISGLENGNTYTLRVTATNIAGTSPEASTTAVPATRPGQPRNIVITPSYGTGTVNLSVTWDAPSRDDGTTTDDGGSAITGYTVQYRASTGNWSFAYFGDNSGAGYPVQITGLAVGPTYYVQIRAHNAGGDSSWVQATTRPTGTPAKPDPVSVSGVSRGGMTAGWTAPDIGASAITDYDVQWCTAREHTATVNQVPTTTYPCTGGWRTAPDADIDETATSYAITGLNGSTPYSVRVRAVNIHGNGPWSDVSASSFATTDAPIAPEAPDAPTVTIGNRQVRLSWTAPEANGARIERYIVECQDDQTPTDVTTGSCSDNTLTQYRTTTSTSITVSGLTNGNRYSFRVSAINSTNRMDGDTRNWSGTVVGTPATRPIRPDPTDITFTEAYANNLVNLTVNWVAPEDTDGSGTSGGSTINGYTLQYRTSGSNWSFHYFGSATNTTINGLPIGGRYDVQIRTHTDAGESTWAQKSTTPTGRPLAPTVSSVSGGTNEVTVNWSAPSNRGEPAITSYNVQRCFVSVNTRGTPTDTSDDWYTCGGWTSAGTTDENGSSLLIGNLPCGRRIGVRVQAVNSYGAGPWSDTTSETARENTNWSDVTADCPTN